MDKVTPEEMTEFRRQFASYPPAMKALDFIEDCEGDLEDAAISLAIRAGQHPQQDNAEWLTALAKRCRAAICQETMRENLLDGSLDKVAIALANLDLVPAVLAAPAIIYALKQGVEDFCQPLDRVL